MKKWEEPSIYELCIKSTFAGDLDYFTEQQVLEWNANNPSFDKKTDYNWNHSLPVS